MRASLLIGLVLSFSLAACDSVAPPTEASPPPVLSADAAPVRFSFEMDDGTTPAAARGRVGAPVRFRARVLTRRPNGTVKVRQGWLRFSAETVAEAGGRTRTVRFVWVTEPEADLRSGRSRLWERGLTAEIPDLDAAEASVQAWLGGTSTRPGDRHLTSQPQAAPAAARAGMARAESATPCRAIQLPADDPICEGDTNC